MSRRIENTVAGGFRCDASGCGMNAIWGVIVVTPYKDAPVLGPILTFTDQHVCQHHISIIRRELVTEPMREAIRAIAHEKGGEPDFDLQRMGKIGVYSPDYHRFQEMAGLIEPGDQVIKSDATVPDIGGLH